MLNINTIMRPDKNFSLRASKRDINQVMIVSFSWALEASNLKIYLPSDNAKNPLDKQDDGHWQEC